MVRYAQGLGLRGGHQIFAFKQVGAVTVREACPEAADILLGLPGNAALSIRDLG